MQNRVRDQIRCPIAASTRLNNENSRERVQNVRGNRSPYRCSVVSRGIFTVASAIDAHAVPAVEMN